MVGPFSRRTFLKGSAALVAALTLASWFPTPRRVSGQNRQLPAAPAFNPLPSSQLATGQPIADISAGWDGTLWAVDTLGIPHIYDPLQQVWQAFGKGVDAATRLNGELYLFRGDEVAIYNQATGQGSVQPISQQWPGLPPSFTNDLDGASVIGGVIQLFRSGRCVGVDSPSVAQALTTLGNWPSSWPDGVIHHAGTLSTDMDLGILFRTDLQPPLLFLVEVGGSLTVFPYLQEVSSLPLYAELATVLDEGFDSYISVGDIASPQVTVFQGPVVWTVANSQPLTAAALGAYVPSWLPILRHAPRGRVGNLWSVTTDGAVVYHDGEQWNVAPAIGDATVLGVDVGEDDAPFIVAQPTGGGGAANLYQYEASTGVWQAPISLGNIIPQQLSVGDASRVYVLGSDGVVNVLANGGFAPVSALPAGIAHITANHDGTLWHSDGSPNAYRFISEQSYGPRALPVPNGANVQKVASTAYGNALLLVNQGGASQLYSYASPYVFKTSPSFVPIANGLVLQNPQVTPGGARALVNLGSGIVALDSHTGEQLWSAALPNQGECTSIVYDPIHRLIYATDSAQSLFALHAATGAELWSYQVTGTISQPVLSGGGLCVMGVTESVGVYVYWISTDAAFAQGVSNQPVSALWQQQVSEYIGVLATAYIDSGYVYVVVVATDIESTVEQLWRLHAQDGSAPTLLYQYGLAGEGGNGDWTGVVASALGRTVIADATSRMLFGNTGNNVEAFPLVPAGTFVAISTPPANGFTQGLAYYDNIVYACGTDNILYALDLSQPLGTGPGFQPLPLPTNGGTFMAGPIVAATASGALIAFSLNLAGANSVCLYDPSTGNLLQLDTDHLLATQLVVDENGILYAAGKDPANPNTPFGQVYAIRIDDLLQQERAFVIESELMQDFDEPTTGQLTATARYQTHVTIVDAQNRPRPFQTIKVWADTELLTLVQIDGIPQYVNATTPARVQTDATGILTIVSDATDLSATALTLWAGFMNPYERIVVYPDREFHNRLTTTHYDNTTSPDPTKINLATASTYTVTNLNQPPPLLYNTQTQQQGAQVVAPVIQQFASSVNYSGGAVQGAGRAGSGKTGDPSPYLAGVFADAFYAPVSTPADRQVTPAATIGLSIDFAAYNSQGGQPVYTSLSVADAANTIDGLSAQTAATPGAFRSWWSDLWAAIKSGAAHVVHFVVSVGRDIYIGLKYILNGAEYILRQALHAIEEVAVAIGSVLAAVGRLIHDVIEGLSLIFHLGQVWNTYTLLKNYVTGWIQTTLPQAIAAQETTINNALGTLENDITTALNNLITLLDAGQVAAVKATGALPIQNMQGMGATSQTAFTVTPSGGKPQMVAVPAMWGAHKLRNNLAQSDAPDLPGASAPDFVDEFIRSFAADPNLQTALSNAKQQYDKSLHPSSAKEFFGMLLGDLLATIELVAVAAIDGIKAGVTTLMTNIAEVVTALGSLGSADIPVLSTLLQLLGLGNVTILDILLFVAAIPITLVYRIAYGAYPGDSIEAGSGAGTTLAKVAGLMSGIMDIINGIFGVISDALDVGKVNLSNAGKFVKNLVGITLVLLTSATYVMGDVVTPSFGVIFASIITILQAFLGMWSPEAAETPSLSMVPSIFGAMMAAPLLLFAYVEAYEEDKDAVALAANVLSTLSLIVNPLKFSESEIAAVPLIVDVVAGLVSGELTIANTLDPSAPVPTALPEAEEPAWTAAHHVYMPAILQGQ